MITGMNKMHNYWILFTQENELAIDEDGVGIRSSLGNTRCWNINYEQHE
jgi:hypothetical protein